MTPNWYEEDYQRTAGPASSTQFLPGTTVEIVHSTVHRTPPRHVLFDFDGTLSLVREGWPEVMVPMMVEVLRNTPTDESPEELHQIAHEFVMQLNGKQTIYQMIQFAERVKARGGTPREPLWYKHEYLRRLDVHIQHRLDGLRSGQISADALLVFGARVLLDHLQKTDLTLYLASGTDEKYVKQEAALLNLDRYFGSHIYGALDDYKRFSKKMVIERILRENEVEGSGLLSFGDGYVEIENTKEVGGLAVAVASDEANNGSGQMDAWKKQRLTGVGADVVIPDFRDALPLMHRILAR